MPGPDPGGQEGHRRRAGGRRDGVLATDSGTLKDLPAWAKKMGHDFLGHYEDSGYLRLFLKKMK